MPTLPASNPGNTTAYGAAVNADNPLAWWRFVEPSGTAFHDSMGLFVDGAYTNCTLGQTPVAPGDGSSVSFNGISSTAIVAALAHSPILTAMSIEWWFNATAFQASNVPVGLVDGTTAINTVSFVPTATSLAFLVRDSLTPTGIAQGNITFSFATGTNYHVILTWTGTTLQCYINGAAQTVAMTSANPLINGYRLGGLYAGNQRTFSRFWNGRLGDISIYPTVLSADRILAHYNAGKSVCYSVSGATGAPLNVVSGDVTILPTSTATDTIPVTSSHVGDVLTPSSISVSSGAAQTFTVTGVSIGPRTITVAPSSGLAVVGSPFTFNVSTPFAATGPSILIAGSPSPIVFTPATATTDVFTPDDDGAGGSYDPPTLTFTNSAAGQTSQYTPAANGALTLGGTSSLGATVTPLVTTSYQVTSDAVVVKSGKFIAVGLNAWPQLNGNWQPTPPTAVNADPTFQIQWGGVGSFHTITTNLVWSTVLGTVMYRAQCGGVQSIGIANGGLTSYTAPTATAPGLTLGTPVLASGLLTYTITSPGSGYTRSFAITVQSSQTPSIKATAWVTVVAGAVTAVTPVEGSARSYGVGYTGTSVTGIALNGSAALGTSASTWTTVPVPGAGLVVTATVGNYIQSVPVVDGGSQMTEPPAITITDATGTGAAAVAVMSGPGPADILTYTTTANWVTTNFTGFSPAPVTNAAVFNSVGQLEPAVGRMCGFQIPPTLAAGFNAGQSPTYYADNVYFTGKNKLKASNPWVLGTATSCTLDSTRYPAFWTPGSSVACDFYGFTGLPSLAQYQGVWNHVYDDDFYGGGLNGATHPAWSQIATTPNSSGVSSSIVPGPFTTMPVAGAVTADPVHGSITNIAITDGGSGLQACLVTLSNASGMNAAVVATVSGGSVTALTILAPSAGYFGTTTAHLTPLAMVDGVVTIPYNINFTSPNTNGKMVLFLNQFSGSDGVQHCHNPWVFAPGNTTDRSNPLASDDNFVSNMTGSNGNGPGVIRRMDSLVGPISANCIDPSDIPDPNLFTWDLENHFGTGVPPGPPNSPTFTGICAAGSAVVTGLSVNTSTLAIGNPIVGLGIPGGKGGTSSVGPPTAIQSIDSASQITLTAPTKITGIQTLSINPTPSGTITFNFYRRYNTNVNSTTLSWSSPNIYSSQNWANSGVDAFGQLLDITKGPLSADDNGKFLAGGNTSNVGGVVEFVSNLPHGLKTSMYTGGSSRWTNTRGFTATTTSGSPNITLPGAGNGSIFVGNIINGPGIPTSPPTTILTVNSNTSMVLSANATASGSQSLTAETAINWNVSGPIIFNSSSSQGSSFVAGVFWVTGPNTVAVAVEVGPNSSVQQFPVSTTPVPIQLTLTFCAPIMSEPYEFHAAQCTIWPNTAMHLNIPFASSDPCVAAIATRVAPFFVGKPNLILLEIGNEPWNTGADVNTLFTWNTLQNNLAKYYPVGTQLYPHFTPTRSVASYTTTGNALGNNRSHYCLSAANKHYVFCQAFAAAGGNPANVKLVYGGQYHVQQTIKDTASSCLNFKLPQDYIAYAPYQDPLYSGMNSPSIAAAQLPAGYAGNPNAGNLPMDGILDLVRYRNVYGTDLQKNWSDMAGWASTGGVTLTPMAYEGGLENLIGPGTPFSDQMQQDALYHPAFYDALWGYHLGLQRGNPNVANTGLAYSSYYSLYWNPTTVELWKIADGVGQPMGLGLTNKFVTPQGGSPGNGNLVGFYQTNQVPGIQSLHDWFGGQSPTPTPTPIPTPTPTHGIPFPKLRRRPPSPQNSR